MLVVVDRRRGLEGAHRDDRPVRHSLTDEKLAAGVEIRRGDSTQIRVQVGVLLVEGTDIAERTLVEVPDCIGVAWFVPAKTEVGH